MQPNAHDHIHHPDSNPNHQPQNGGGDMQANNPGHIPHPDPNTPSNYYADNTLAPLNLATAQHQLADHANLSSAIFSLNLGNISDPQIPVNSPASSTDNTLVHPTNTTDLNLVPEEASQGSLNEEVAPNYPLRRTWVDGIGPYITTGELRVQIDVSSNIESDSETMRMFNLDKLNEGRPKWLHSDAWDVGQILER